MSGLLEVVVLYNQPLLPPSNPDWASEAGVLETVEAATAALAARGHRARAVGVSSSAAEIVDALTGSSTADVVLNLCEGLGGTGAGEATVAGLIELCGLPLTGSPADCLSLVRDKARTKWLLQGAGLPTAPFVHLPAGHRPPRQTLEAMLIEGPCLVKPAKEDASLGISQESVATDFEQVQRQIAAASRYGDVLVERYIPGREFNVGIVALDRPKVLPIGEIDFGSPAENRWRLVTYDAKWTPGSADYISTPVTCPAPIEPELADQLQAAALAAFRVTGCRQYARVDFRVDSSGAVYILEVNANPDLAPSAGFARCLAVAGLNYDGFVERLVQSAAAHRIGRQICTDIRLAATEQEVVTGP